MSSNQLVIKGNYSERLTAICDTFIQVFGWDIEQETADAKASGRRIIHADEEIKKVVYKAKSDAMFNYALGITSLYERLDKIAALISMTSADDFTPENIQLAGIIGKVIFDIKELYTEWESKEYKGSLKSLVASDFFKDKDFYVDPSILEAVHDLIFKEQFQCYKYKDKGDTILFTDKFHLASQIGFSTDLTMWFSHIQRQEEFLMSQPKNEVFVTLFGKLDEVHPIYSNWVLTLHKGNSIWIVTDQRKFDNPMQKKLQLQRKGTKRDVTEMRDNCDLPYDLFEDIDKLRAKQSGLSKHSAFKRHKTNFKEKIAKLRLWIKDDKRASWNELERLFEEKLTEEGIAYDVAYGNGEKRNYLQYEPETMIARKGGTVVAIWRNVEENEMITVYDKAEVLFHSLADLQDGEKAFLVMLTKEAIEYISGMGKKLSPIMLAQDFINMKMIEGAKINPTGATMMEYWTKKNSAIVQELLETIEEGEVSTALALKTYDLVAQHENYSASWLGTPKELKSLSEWYILDAEAKTLYGKIRALAQTEREAEKWLEAALEAKYFGICDKIMKYGEVRFVTTIQDSLYGAKQGNAGYVISLSRLGRDEIGIGKPAIGGKCRCCNKENPRVVRAIEFYSYKEIMWLLDLKDRKELPKYYRQYRKYNLIPYMGNSLLDQTHPYLDLEDPCSRENCNGIRFIFFMCAKCAKKIKKEKEVLTVKY